MEDYVVEIEKSDSQLWLRGYDDTLTPIELADPVDLIALCDVIEHVDDVNTALAEWRRVLRPGGILAMETPPLHKTLFTLTI